MKKWEILFEAKIISTIEGVDPAHDLLHFKRVVKAAKLLCEVEKANLEIVIPAAWLHDLVIISKDDPRRSKASELSAKSAIEYLSSINYPEKYYKEIAHAIEAHSFSANIETKSVEAKIVQDADRLDALGAIGIARCLLTGGLLKRTLYSDIDPFCRQRKSDDQNFTIDHFYLKLFQISESMQTETGKLEAHKRIKIMKNYLNDLSLEIE